MSDRGRLRASNGQVYTYTPPHPAEMKFTDWLDHELAIEDHRHGMAYGSVVGHCSACDQVQAEARQAMCRHDGEQAEITSLCDANRRLLCNACGLVRGVPR